MIPILAYLHTFIQRDGLGMWIFHSASSDIYDDSVEFDTNLLSSLSVRSTYDIKKQWHECRVS